MVPETHSGIRILNYAPDGHKLRGERDAVEIIGTAMEHGADMAVIPAERFDDDFFRLGTGIAGEMVQKFATYRLRLAVVGDISRHLAASSALRDFVRETNRGDQLWFLPDAGELGERLTQG
jgi:hypothetical protein